MVMLLYGLFIQQSMVRERRRWKELLLFLCVSLFYVGYSFYIGSNSQRLIFTDYIIEVKPFVAFFCFRILDFSFTEKDKKILNRVSLVGCALLFCIGALGFLNNSIVLLFFSHPSRLATSAIITSLLYLMTANQTGRERYIYLVILAAGLFSMRSKFFGYAAIATAFVWFDIYKNLLKINVKSIVIFAVMILVAGYFSWDKFYFYFIHGSQKSVLGNAHQVDPQLFARPALFLAAFHILLDYIPFGTGLASFATYASGISYSTVYYHYGLHRVFGLEPGNHPFISDTYYPVLAQFGLFGVFLYLLFWALIVKKIRRLQVMGSFQLYENKRWFMVGGLIVVFFIIESVADSTMIQNRGVFMMILLAVAMNEIDRLLEKKEVSVNRR